MRALAAVLTMLSTGCFEGVSPRGVNDGQVVSETDGGIVVEWDGGLADDAGLAAQPDAGALPDAAVALIDGAQIVSTEIPAAIPCGAASVLRVTMLNAGTTEWTSGVHRLAATAASHPIAIGLAVELPGPIAPGTAYTFELAFTAPATPGAYPTSWQMQRSGVGFGAVASGTTQVECTVPTRPLPDMSAVVRQVHDENPDLIRQSCQDTGGNWAFLDAVVDRLRQTDDRWGYNWKRGVIGDPSEDVVDYHWGDGPREGSPDTYVVDVIAGHCGDDPQPAFIDVTLPGVLGLWTGRGRF
jgi:hypothetical protein